jgi:ankyrin repeat protein
MSTEAFIVDLNLPANEQFYSACFQGNLVEAKALLATGHVDVMFQASNGWNALHAAANGGSLEMVKHLCSKGIDPEDANALGQRPLHLAAAAGQGDVCSWLVDIMNADAKAKTSGGSTAADIAKLGGYTDLAERLAGTEVVSY